MQESMERTKSTRHDMKTHLAAINAHAAEGKVDKIADYIGGLLGGLDTARIYSDTGNAVFDSIINFKLRNAERENIKPDIRLNVPPTLNAETSDIAVILGNLLDNAIEAVARVEDRWIRISADCSRGVLVICVKNPFDGVLEYARKTGAVESKTRESPLPITRKTGGDHGRGLRNIQRTLEKYDGALFIKLKERNVFSAAVLLYGEEMKVSG